MITKKGEVYRYTGRPYGDIETGKVYIAERDQKDGLWPIGTVNIIIYSDGLTRLNFKHYVETLNQK